MESHERYAIRVNQERIVPSAFFGTMCKDFLPLTLFSKFIAMYLIIKFFSGYCLFVHGCYRLGKFHIRYQLQSVFDTRMGRYDM